jgi:hypothetical protein
MRNNETYFEQVPLDAVETALQKCPLHKGMTEKPTSVVLMPEDGVVSEFSKRKESEPLKGKSCGK